MNKVFAEILAGMIPHKHTRNRWRGILRYGITNAWKLKRIIKENHSAPTHYLAVCAIAKNEGPYFKEWIEWHKSQGVEKFYIYDNESTDNTRQILQPYIESGIVEYKFFPGRKRQLAAYDDCFERHRFDARWIAVIDIDEFIVPQMDASIPAFLRRMEGYASVEINWLVYGSSGAKKKEAGEVMKRFRKHSQPEHKLNTHVKSIIDPRQVCCMIGCHEAARLSGKAVDPNGNIVKVHFGDRKPQQDVIRINHATLQFGATTASFDKEYTVDFTYPKHHVSRQMLEKALRKFVGDIEQVPPVFSACNVNGKRAYELGRKGHEVELQAKTVHIEDIELLNFDDIAKTASIRVVCGKGTYIRSLARDIGKAVGSGAFLTALCRTRVGSVRIEDCLTMDDFQEWLDRQDIAEYVECVQNPPGTGKNRKRHRRKKNKCE